MTIRWNHSNLFRFTILLIATSALAKSTNRQVYDGIWWSSTTTEQHSGWLAGYLDCSVIHGKTEFGFTAEVTLAQEVTKFYSSNPKEIVRPVASVAHEIVAKSPKPPKGAKSQMHSGFDGDYWRQSLPEHREGYVQGFIACYRELKNPPATFSKAPSSYVFQISKWFGIKEDDPAEIELKRQYTAISKVLFMFKDAAPKSSHRKNTNTRRPLLGSSL